MRKSLLYTVALCTFFPALAQAQTAPVAPTFETWKLSGWMENQFRSLGTTCAGGRFKVKNGRSAIPGDVFTQWGAVPPAVWGSQVKIYPTFSLNALFSKVYQSAPNGPMTETGSIPFPWGSDGPPLMSRDLAQASRAHNCATLMSGRLDSSLKIDFIGINAALEASRSDERSETAFLYAGKMNSPLAAAMGLGDAIFDKLPLSRFTVLLSIWDWYKNRPELVSASNANTLWVEDAVSGLAVYRASGLTQNSMLSGNGGFGLSLPFLKVGGDAEVNGTIGVKSRFQNFSVAVWDSTPRINLKPPSWIAGELEKRAEFDKGSGNPVRTDGEAFNYTIDIRHIPPAFCQAYWTHRAPAVSNNQPAYNLVSTESVTTEDRTVCRFVFRVTPPAESTNGEIAITPALVSRIVLPGGAAPIDLVLTPPPTFTVADGRSEFRPLVNGSLTPLTLPVGAQSIPGQANYMIVARDRAVVGVYTTVEAMTITCGSKTAVVNGSFTFKADSSPEAVQIAYTLPVTLFQGVAAGATVGCTAAMAQGPLRIITGQSTISVRLPAYPFEVTVAKPAV